MPLAWGAYTARVFVVRNVFHDTHTQHAGLESFRHQNRPTTRFAHLKETRERRRNVRRRLRSISSSANFPPPRQSLPSASKADDGLRIVFDRAPTRHEMPPVTPHLRAKKNKGDRDTPRQLPENIPSCSCSSVVHLIFFLVLAPIPTAPNEKMITTSNCHHSTCRPFGCWPVHSKTPTYIIDGVALQPNGIGRPRSYTIRKIMHFQNLMS